MIFFLLDLGLSVSWWSLNKTYEGARYIVYGNEPTKEDLIIKELEELKKEIKMINK